MMQVTDNNTTFEALIRSKTEEHMTSRIMEHKLYLFHKLGRQRILYFHVQKKFFFIEDIKIENNAGLNLSLNWLLCSGSIPPQKEQQKYTII